MTDLIDTVQLQEIDAGIVELFDFTLPSGTTVYLFKGLENGTNSVWFPNKQGTVLNEYLAIPLELTGISFSSSGASNRPTLTIANIPALTRSPISSAETTLIEIKESENILSEEGVFKNEDLLGTEVVYRTTLSSHLKTQQDSPSLPIEFPSQKFILDRVASENNILVEFELANPFDLEGVTLPFREVIGKYCPWEYQGHALGGRGGCTWPLDSRGVFFDKDNNKLTLPPEWNSGALTYPLPVGTKVHTNDNQYIRIWEVVRSTPESAKDPRINGPYWKRLDVCGKTIQACKVRFQKANADPYDLGTEYSFNDLVSYQGNIYVYKSIDSSTGVEPFNTLYWEVYTGLDTSKSLPFGGFPGVNKFK